MSFFDRIISGTVDLVFSKGKRIERWLVLLIIVGFILRLIAALNLSVLPDDMIKATQSAGIINSKMLSTSSAPPLFYYMTDLAYKIFGYTTFASRFWPLIFGTLLIPLVFLIAGKFFGKKAGLFAAFFVTFSNFIITQTFTEESLIVLLFCMFGTYFGLEYLGKKRYRFIILSGLLFGLAAITKYSAPFFVFSFLLFSLYYLKANNEKIFAKKNVKSFLIFFIIIFLFCVPFLAFNYFIYKDKGILDVYFSRVIRTENSQKLYGSLGGQGTTFFQNLFNPASYSNPLLFFKTDFLIYLFALFGIIGVIRNKHNIQLFFLIIFIIVPFILQSGGSSLQKHFVFIPFIFSIYSGYGFSTVYNKINKKGIIFMLLFLLAAIMIINLGAQSVSPQNYFSKSAESSLKSFINKNVENDGLIVFDPRIYTSQYFWLGTPHHLLNFHQFIEFYNYNQNLSNEYKTLTKVYVVECAKDDCGWGTIKDQPDFNATTENILAALTQNSKFLVSINYSSYGGNELFEKKTSVNKYNAYSMTVELSPQLVGQTDYLNSFYFAPYLYKNIDNYVYKTKLESGFDKLLNLISLLIIYLAILLSVLSIFLVYYLFL